MVPDSPLQISQFALSLMGTRMHTYYQNRIPRDGALLVVSNHRSVMDAPVLMAAMNRSILPAITIWVRCR
jgi:1-acyl-sn-glycerol-3-phosphate acyltransferase